MEDKKTPTIHERIDNMRDAVRKLNRAVASLEARAVKLAEDAERELREAGGEVEPTTTTGPLAGSPKTGYFKR